MSEKSQKIDDWVKKISESDFPIFKSTVSAISNITLKDDASASELAGAILRDPSLTAKILKFANSSYYNPSKAQTNTISRAVVLMGFEVVRDLSLSMAVIESLLKGKTREIVADLMARSFHAATQARAIAQKNGETKLEEIFIATLMHDIGEMAFWCTAEAEIVEEFVEEMETSELASDEVEKKVLGFKFIDLTKSLLAKWNLNKELEEAINDAGSQKPHVQYIYLGRQVAEAVPSGWESNKAKKIYQKLAGKLGISIKDSKKMVRETAKTAAEVAKNYGASSVAELIPGFADIEEQIDEKSEVEIAQFPEPDPILQLKILRELSSLVKANPDLNLIIETLLEGIHRGVGMDRAFFALYIPLKSQVRAKYAVGVDAELLLNNFSISVGDITSNPFSEALFDKGTGMWLTSATAQNYSRNIMHKIDDMLGTNAFFISPVVVNGRPIGLFYADRKPSKRQLDTVSFESFDHFSCQASFTIELISNRLAGKE